MMEHIANSIREAQLVLVGVGEEFEAKRLLKSNEDYQRIIEKVQEDWIVPYVQKVMLEQIGTEVKAAYKQLSDCLNNKNYYVISLCQDGWIRSSGIDPNRISEPCGTYEALQCSEGCNHELYVVPEELLAQIKKFVAGEIPETDLKQPVCPRCGKPLVFNQVEAEHYVEEGYLAKWQKYKLWLQGTVNKKLCVLELGVGMKYPSVIRWPFEKIVFFNQKAELFRVHSKLYQMTEEIKEKGYGICSSPVDFLKELSNRF